MTNNNSPTPTKALQELRDEMRATKHYECEDKWYSCPLSDEGCADERQTDCTCNATVAHERADRIDAILTSLASAPVAETREAARAEPRCGSCGWPFPCECGFMPKPQQVAVGLLRAVEKARGGLAPSGPMCMPIPLKVPGPCEKCDGDGWTDEGDPDVGSAPFECDRCLGTGKEHTCGRQASCVPCEEDDRRKTATPQQPAPDAEGLLNAYRDAVRITAVKTREERVNAWANELECRAVLLRAYAQAGQRDGWKLVPVKMTEQMAWAYELGLQDAKPDMPGPEHGFSNLGMHQQAYTAMLNASPPPGSAGEGGTT